MILRGTLDPGNTSAKGSGGSVPQLLQHARVSNLASHRHRGATEVHAKWSSPPPFRFRRRLCRGLIAYAASQHHSRGPCNVLSAILYSCAFSSSASKSPHRVGSVRNALASESPRSLSS